MMTIMQWNTKHKLTCRSFISIPSIIKSHTYDNFFLKSTTGSLKVLLVSRKARPSRKYTGIAAVSSIVHTSQSYRRRNQGVSTKYTSRCRR